MTDNFVRIDLPKVHRDNAFELMVHHLMMAAALFEAAPDDRDGNAAELERLMLAGVDKIMKWQDDGGLGCAVEVIGFENPPHLVAARAWLLTIEDYYEGLKTDDERAEEKRR